MAKRKYIYCWNCGLKNRIEDKKCTKCRKKLLDEDKDELGTFVIDKLLDEGKGEVEKKFKEKFRDFVSKKLFGILLSASVVFAGSTIVANILKKNEESKESYMQVQSPFAFESMLEAHDQTCEEGYTLTDGKCLREVSVSAERHLTCADGFTLSNARCLKEVEKEEIKECILPVGFVYSGDACSPLEIKYIENTNAVFKKNCMVSAYEWVDTTDADGNPTRKCNNGGRVDFFDPTISYRCPSGSIERSGKCYNASTPKENFACKEGTLEGQNCIKTEIGKKEVSCDEGYEYNEIVSLCIKK